MIARLTVLLVLGVSVVVIAAGCGDESSDADTTAEATAGTTSGTTELSKAEYLKRANAGCRKERVDLEEEISEFLQRQSGKKPPEVLYADLAHLVILPVIENEMEAVRALGATPGGPDEDQEVNYLLYAEEAALNEIALSQRMPSREAIEKRFTKSGRMLSEYGLPDCANGLDVKSSG
ncbi:MAG: hypothetical protein WA687_06300 [Solirubrobacterales bacterium]